MNIRPWREVARVSRMPELNAIGIVVSDVARSIAFYRLLGVDFPEGG